MPSSTSSLGAKIGPPWAHLGTFCGQMDLWSASTMWTPFSPSGCAASQLCSTNTLMPFNMPYKPTKCRTCYTIWMITVGPPDCLACTNNIVTMTATCEELSFAVNPKKVTKPATTTNFLGVDINAVTMEARIDPSCLSETISQLEDILGC